LAAALELALAPQVRLELGDGSAVSHIAARTPLATKGCRIAPTCNMRPFPAACRANIALVELCHNGVVARCPGAHDLLNDRLWSVLM
jgi:hypothetical protein